MPTWKDFAPRVGVVYDLFGNSKTALKAGFNRYNESRTTQFATKYNPLALTSLNLTWTDAQRRRHRRRASAAAPSARPAARSTSPAADQLRRPLAEHRRSRLPAHLQPRVHRRHPARAVPARVGVGHLLPPPVLRPAGDRQPAAHAGRLPRRGRGQPARRLGVQRLHRGHGRAAGARCRTSTPTPASDRKQTYNGGDITFNARLPRGGTLFGGFTMERTLRVTCDEPDDPNFLRFCDDGENDIPFLKQFKFAGTYPLGWGIQASVSFQSINGRADRRLHRHHRRRIATASTAPATATSAARSARAGWSTADHALRRPTALAPVPPGRAGDPRHDRGVSSRCRWSPAAPSSCDRINQLDLSLAKWFELGGSRRLQLQADVFNIMNANPVLGCALGQLRHRRLQPGEQHPEPARDPPRRAVEVVAG